MKRFFAFLLVTVMLLTALVGCQPAGEDGTEQGSGILLDPEKTTGEEPVKTQDALLRAEEYLGDLSDVDWEEQMLQEGYILFDNCGTAFFIWEEETLSTEFAIIVNGLKAGEEVIPEGLESGDSVIMLSASSIMESYPAQIAVYKLAKLQDGSLENIPRRVVEELLGNFYTPDNSIPPFDFELSELGGAGEPETGSETETETVYIPGPPPGSDYQTKQAALSGELFRQILKARENDDSMLISPLSIMIALAMTQNGATGDTLTDLEEFFGMSCEELNQGLSEFAACLPSSKEAKLHLANSIWFRKDSMVLDSAFAEKNVSLYKATLEEALFDQSTVDAINGWVSENTDGMIKKLLDQIDPDVMMYLINALLFDAAWRDPYLEYQVQDGEFTAIDGNTQTVQMMKEQEHYLYIDDKNAEGFLKYYQGGYAFVALLPDEGVSVYDYAENLNLLNIRGALTDSRSYREIITEIPQFNYEYSTELSGVLKTMGLDHCFAGQGADFSGMGQCPEGNLCISRVLHKTVIEVTAYGTKAAAVTAVEMEAESAEPSEPPIEISLDRPFVYMIVETETMLPIFMGVVTEIGE